MNLKALRRTSSFIFGCLVSASYLAIIMVTTKTVVQVVKKAGRRTSQRVASKSSSRGSEEASLDDVSEDVDEAPSPTTTSVKRPSTSAASKAKRAKGAFTTSSDDRSFGAVMLEWANIIINSNVFSRDKGNDGAIKNLKKGICELLEACDISVPADASLNPGTAVVLVAERLEQTRVTLSDAQAGRHLAEGQVKERDVRIADYEKEVERLRAVMKKDHDDYLEAHTLLKAELNDNGKLERRIRELEGYVAAVVAHNTFHGSIVSDASAKLAASGEKLLESKTVPASVE